MNNCEHPNPIHTRRGTSVWRQCRDCFQTVGSAIKKATFEQHQLDAMPLFDEAAREEHQRKIDEAWREQRQQERDFESIAWWAKYNAYLNGPVWAAKRQLVLRRDDHWCKACAGAQAVHVHHKTYEHVFDEPLFDLEAVCIPCHEKLHKKPMR